MTRPLAYQTYVYCLILLRAIPHLRLVPTIFLEKAKNAMLLGCLIDSVEFLLVRQKTQPS